MIVKARAMGLAGRLRDYGRVAAPMTAYGLLDVALWLWPAICPVICKNFHMLLMPLASALAVARTYQRARAGQGRADLPPAAAVLPRPG